MVEVVVCDVLTQLALVAAQKAEQELRLVIGVDEAIRKLQGNLLTVKAMLNDAERRQFKEEAVRLLLEKLTDACYEMDDVVDEWNTTMVKLAIQKQAAEDADKAPPVRKKKVCSFTPSPSCCFRQVAKLQLHHDIAHKIIELDEKFDEIIKEREMYGLELSEGSASKDQSMTTLLVDESTFLGCDEHIGYILSGLLG